jgi:hypothetical protein
MGRFSFQTDTNGRQVIDEADLTVLPKKSGIVCPPTVESQHRMLADSDCGCGHAHTPGAFIFFADKTDSVIIPFETVQDISDWLKHAQMYASELLAKGYK